MHGAMKQLFNYVFEYYTSISSKYFDQTRNPIEYLFKLRETNDNDLHPDVFDSRYLDLLVFLEATSIYNKKNNSYAASSKPKKYNG